ncbi:MAG: YhdP family protein, partial [Pseudomonadota bacterium]
YRTDIEQRISQALGQTVTIGRVEASWRGLNPDLVLRDVRVADAQGHLALALDRVETVLSWWSIPTLRLNLALLSIEEPTLHLRRDSSGQVFVAGIPLNMHSADNERPAALDWILAQQRIRIRGATVLWEDALRQAPALTLEDLNLALDKKGSRHLFGLTALPPANLASKIDLRGDFVEGDFARLDSLHGKFFAQVESADMAVWQRWIDYPLALSQGRGGLRLWADFAAGTWRAVTLDLAVNDVRLALSKTLPELDLVRLSGRLTGQRSAEDFLLRGQAVALQLRPSSLPQPISAGAPISPNIPSATLQITPTDFELSGQRESPYFSTIQQAPVSLNFQANHLDLAVLNAVAAYFPPHEAFAKWVHGLQPQGQLLVLEMRAQAADFALSKLNSYALKAEFNGLSVKAEQGIPGMTGLAGAFEATEQGGTLSLNSRQSSIDLPNWLPTSPIAFDRLQAQAKWHFKKGLLEVDLPSLTFSSADGAGTAQGHYQYAAQGLGRIDLKAKLDRVEANSVWRYLPHTVHETTRHWLRDALKKGKASDVRLVLQGELADFPFADKKHGEFSLTAKVHDLNLDYATGWPEITGLRGDLRFAGPALSIHAQEGHILGTQFATGAPVHAEIADLHAPLSLLTIRGGITGPSEAFLKFIAQSPVAEYSGHFSEAMHANGQGQLDLDLLLPLSAEHMSGSRVNGRYRFLPSIASTLLLDPNMPPLRQVTGQVQFSEKEFRIPELSAYFLGSPIKLKGGSQPDGRVLITANGLLNLTQLRKKNELPVSSPLFDHLAGSLNYRAELRVKNHSAALSIDSNLLGLASSLPEPFAKAAGETMPLHIERTFLPPTPQRAAEAIVRDQWQLALGNVLSLQAIRRKQADAYVLERAALAVGKPLSLPERGFSLAVNAKRLDLDLWRDLLRAGAPAAAASSAPALPFSSVQLKASSLKLFDRQFNEVDLSASAALSANANANRWKIHLTAREASGDLQWDGAGRGKLTARLKHWLFEPNQTLSATKEGGAQTAKQNSKSLQAELNAPELFDALPALDIVAEDFVLATQALGRLELQAHNESRENKEGKEEKDSRFWRLDKLVLASPLAHFSGTGRWQPPALPNASKVAVPTALTQLDFKLDAQDLGQLLARLGYAGTIKNGHGQLAGQVSWNGSPFAFDYASLSGALELELLKGQFLKLDPGAGKLLGLISLQALPRRITLDFRDVFSDGFAFDSIAGKLSLAHGLMRTERLQIEGPSARVVMRGETDLQKETQQLEVNVQPDLGGGAALGVALINPLAGVATLLANKLFQKPLDQIFGFDYLVTGTWDDPKVEKVVRASDASDARSRSVVPAPAKKPANAN